MDSSFDQLLNRLFLQAEVKASNIEKFAIPKLEQEIARITLYMNDIRENVKKAREGDETALIALIRHAFPSPKG